MNGGTVPACYDIPIARRLLEAALHRATPHALIIGACHLGVARAGPLQERHDWTLFKAHQVQPQALSCVIYGLERPFERRRHT